VGVFIQASGKGWRACCSRLLQQLVDGLVKVPWPAGLVEEASKPGRRDVCDIFHEALSTYSTGKRRKITNVGTCNHVR
jgi:hypothetical protein